MEATPAYLISGTERDGAKQLPLQPYAQLKTFFGSSE
jgi:hypothetical protein